MAKRVRSRPSRLVLAFGVAGLAGLLLLGVAARFWWPKTSSVAPASQPAQSLAPPEDPVSPYLNTAPGVEYVGDQACTRCHEGLARSYHLHPMGRSLRPVSESTWNLDFPAGAANSFTELGYRYSVEKRGSQIVHREMLPDAEGRVLAETEEPVTYAIGSGTHAISYLVDHEGILTQSPLTWYADKKAWDLSPGFKGTRDRFERQIAPGCLFCHCNQANFEPNKVNSYRTPIFRGYAIGCERCHGPGALHVAARTKAPLEVEQDLTIVNPGRLSPGLRDDVCNQCHLGGSERVERRARQAVDYRPGLPLERFLRVFVLPRDAAQGNRVAGHAEQMRDSQCAIQSGGKLGCISCHDPHELPAPAAKVSYYRDRCLKCHQDAGCKEPRAARLAKTPADDCILCHMPRGATNITHVALTDHRILRRPEPRGAPPELPSVEAALRAVPFGQNHVDWEDPEQARDLAVGLVTRARVRSEQFRQATSAAFLPILQKAVQGHPEDVPAGECLEVALAWQGKLPQALSVADAVLRTAPSRELVLSDAGLISQRMGLTSQSFDYWQRALAINPRSSRYGFEVANLLSQKGDWEQAARVAQGVVARNGVHSNSRLLLMQYYLQKGLKVEARKQLLVALATHPFNEAQLRQRFGELLQ
jgi:tetratricopeptide (TPR) repeat protein